MTDNGNGIVLQNELKRALRWLTLAVVIMYVVLALVGGFLFVSASHQRDDIEAVSNRTQAALCSLTHDLERRIASARDFIRRNPDGIPGITVGDIRHSIQDQRITLESLATLNCPPEEL